MAEIRIHEKIFESYPIFRRGIVGAKQMEETKTNLMNTNSALLPIFRHLLRIPLSPQAF